MEKSQALQLERLAFIDAAERGDLPPAYFGLLDCAGAEPLDCEPVSFLFCSCIGGAGG